MTVTMKSLGLDQLSLEERLALVEEIWDSIAADNNAPPLMPAQARELIAAWTSTALRPMT